MTLSDEKLKELGVLRYFDEHMLLIAATRYFIGRMTIATGSFCDALCAAWETIPDSTRKIIQSDIEDAFRRDDFDRQMNAGYRTLGMDIDRAGWEKVRAKYQSAANTATEIGRILKC